MSPEAYFAEMLITQPQKAKRILAAIQLENYLIDVFGDEYEDILDGTFMAKQEIYVDRIIDGILKVAQVNITDTDDFSKEVINKAITTATQIQETTKKRILTPTKDSDPDTKALIMMGIAIGKSLLTPDLKVWLSELRAETIANNESNWIYNHEEYEEALSKYSTKIWHTALDEKVRLTHAEAEGEEIAVEGLFTIGGSLMRFPGDMNGDLSEVINCRCTVEYKK